MRIQAWAALMAVASVEVSEAGHFSRIGMSGKRAGAEAGGIFVTELGAGHLRCMEDW